MAHRAMGHVELGGGTRHGEMAGRGFEGAQRVERRQSLRHRHFTGSACERFTSPSAKLDSIEATPSSLVSFSLRKRS